MGDGGVIQCRKQLRFALEAPETFTVPRELFRKDFDRDLTLELDVARPVNFTHAARANGLEDFVVAELRSRGQGHRR